MRRIALTLFVCASVLASVGVGVMSATAVRAARKTAAVYDQLTNLSMKNRKHYVVTFSVSQRRNIWLEHIRRFEQANQLTAQQKGFIREMRGLLQLPSLEEQKKYVTEHDVTKRARDLFGNEKAEELGAQLGGPEPSKERQLSFESTNDYKVIKASFKKTPNPVCTCASDDSWCTSCVCVTSCQSCVEQIFSCGWFLLSTCNGCCGCANGLCDNCL